MIPTPIPDEEIWPGAERVVIGPPAGEDPTGRIRPAEALIDETDFGRTFHFRLVLEPGELERLQKGEPMWLSLIGNAVQPFDVGMTSEPEDK